MLGEYSDDEMLELEGHDHLLTVQPVEGDRWVALLGVWPDGREGGQVYPALLDEEDCEELIKYLSNLLTLREGAIL